MRPPSSCYQFILIIRCHVWIPYVEHRFKWQTYYLQIGCVVGDQENNGFIHGEFPSQRPMTRGFDVFFNLRLNKRLSKQSWGWWFEMSSPSLWRHCNAIDILLILQEHFSSFLIVPCRYSPDFFYHNTFTYTTPWWDGYKFQVINCKIVKLQPKPLKVERKLIVCSATSLIRERST